MFGSRRRHRISPEALKAGERAHRETDMSNLRLVIAGLKPATLTHLREVASWARSAGLHVGPYKKGGGRFFAISRGATVGETIDNRREALFSLPSPLETIHLYAAAANLGVNEFIAKSGYLSGHPINTPAVDIVCGLVFGYRPCCIRYYVARERLIRLFRQMGGLGNIFGRGMGWLEGRILGPGNRTNIRCARCRNMCDEEYYATTPRRRRRAAQDRKTR